MLGLKYQAIDTILRDCERAMGKHDVLLGTADLLLRIGEARGQLQAWDAEDEWDEREEALKDQENSVE